MSERRAGAGAAFFDVDETLITVKSMFAFLRHWLAENGDDGGEYARITDEIKERAAAGTPREEINRHYYRVYRGVEYAALAESGKRWFGAFAADGAPFYLDTLEALRAHHDSGVRTVLLSGSFAPAIAPVADAVGADHIIATEPVLDEHGVLTGEVHRPMIGEAKGEAVVAYLREHGISPDDTWGYGDHSTDLPFLWIVAHPFHRGDDPHLLAAATAAWRRLGDRVGDANGTEIADDRKVVSAW
ncbi:HAD family hydrolase [Nocardia sp. NPDC060259]|uniref:HAD family hydrolase n=1 Tax=Nocardia sp. NPDC060259 TaxID=3347088 RepID=UPI003646B0A2